MALPELDGKLPWVFSTVAMTLLLGLLKWFGQRDVKRVDDLLTAHTEKIGELQRTMISREELKETIAEFTSLRREMHEQNREALSNLLKTITDNERRDAKTRHDIRDHVGLLTLQMEILARAQGVDIPHSPAGRYNNND